MSPLSRFAPLADTMRFLSSCFSVVVKILLTATAGAGAVTGLDVNELYEIFSESVGEIMHTMVNTGYSKEQEFEADIAAMYLMAYAGYHPSGLIDMLNELKKSNTGTSGFKKTHPTPGQRIYYAERALGRFNISDTGVYRQDRFRTVMLNSSVSPEPETEE